MSGFSGLDWKILPKKRLMPSVVVFLHSIYSNYADKIAQEEQNQCGDTGL